MKIEIPSRDARPQHSSYLNSIIRQYALSLLRQFPKILYKCIQLWKFLKPKNICLWGILWNKMLHSVMANNIFSLQGIENQSIFFKLKCAYYTSTNLWVYLLIHTVFFVTIKKENYQRNQDMPLISKETSNSEMIKYEKNASLKNQWNAEIPWKWDLVNTEVDEEWWRLVFWFLGK